MRCSKTQKLLSTRFDQEIEGTGNSALEAHLSRCSACQRFAANLSVCSQALDAAFAPEPRPGFTARVLARLPERGAKPAWLRDWLDGLRVGHTAAAVLALSCGVVLALSMNGEQRSGVSVRKQPAEALYTESFNALPGDSAEARYLALFEEREN